ncbi:MAG TPA: hypothetical protein VEQ59_12270, partial [Polyangiaceae bacterium]|nr:hypothetical protein [Polyangiaceae bacterium]
AAIALTVSNPARAEEPSSADSLRSKATRRSDFTIGTSGGFGFGRASGYPNEIQKIDDKAYRSNTKLGVGSGGLLWLGVAFNDYLTFGFAMGQFGLSGNDRTASAGVFGFHLDAFPLFDIDENLRDLAVFTNVGTGPLKITGGPEDAEGGLLAYVEGGVAYERLRLWRFGIGPTASLIHMWSDSAQLTGALIGARVALYTGP